MPNGSRSPDFPSSGEPAEAVSPAPSAAPAKSAGVSDASSPGAPRPGAPRLLVVAAEASGDQHAAHLVRALKKSVPELDVAAFGGPALREAGCRLYADLTGSASMILGFLKGVGRYAKVLRLFDEALAEERPAAVLLVDSPGLNFLLARFARWRGIPIAYYVCPQIWAWAPWRRWKVLRWTDLLLAILPFEEELYAGGGVPVRYVGHPLADELSPYGAERGERLRKALGVGEGGLLVGLFPGSRSQEVEALAEVFCALLERIEAPARATVAASCYREEFRPRIESAAARHGFRLEVVSGDARELMMACDLAVVASGTASLELAYFERPMVVLYRTNRTGRLFFEYFSVTPWISLPNILGCPANRPEPTVDEELFTDEPSAEIVARARALLEDPSERERARAKLRRLKETALAPGGVERAARALLDFLGDRLGGGG